MMLCVAEELQSLEWSKQIQQEFSLERATPMSQDAVLDFVNTLYMEGDALVDRMKTDQDVQVWLRGHDLSTDSEKELSSRGLLSQARGLRELFRSILLQIRSGQPAELKKLNWVLARAASHLQITSEGSVFAQERVFEGRSVAVQLGPLSEAFVKLLVSGDLSRVRQCAAPDCILWFRDHAAGGRRLYCSETGCGTRMRVAAHRAKRARTAVGPLRKPSKTPTVC